MGVYAFNPLLLFPKDHTTVTHGMACKLGYDGEEEDNEALLRFYRKLHIQNFFLVRCEQFLNKVRICKHM